MKRSTVALLGAALLAIGVFTPIVSMPVVGSVNYFRNGEGDGVVILVLVLISLLLMIPRWFRGLIVTGTLSLIMLLVTFLRFRQMLSDMRSSMSTDLADNPFRGLGEAMLQSVQLQWGWALLVLGSILLIAAGLMREAQPPAEEHDRDQRDCPWCAERILRKAVVCKHCGREIGTDSSADTPASADDEWSRKERETRDWIGGS